MSKNKLFLNAEGLHRNVVNAKQKQLFNEVMIKTCRQAIYAYVELALMACDIQACGSLPGNILTLQEMGNFDVINAYSQAAVIEAAYLSKFHKQVQECHLVCANYLNLRTAILEWLIENKPPKFDNGNCYHEATGVRIEAEPYSYTHALEEYYDI